MSAKLAEIFSPLIHLLYPHVCTGCGSDILQAGNLLCIECINDLPRTNFASQPENPVEKIFWGRLANTAAFSEFYFTKDSVIQTLIHQLKYKSNKEIGLYLGNIMAESISKSERFNDVDVLIPLPMFPEKEKKRGYNQATIICNGITEILNIPVNVINVQRAKFTETQTKKGRSERWQNVDGSFMINNPTSFENRHVMLIDDVITTGATLEACGAELLKISGLKLSIASVAFTSK